MSSVLEDSRGQVTAGPQSSPPPLIIVPRGIQTDSIIKGIAQKMNDNENAFYVFNMDDVIDKLRLWKEELPRVKPFFAVKCNDHRRLLQLLVVLGINFDCASKVEMEKILSLGVDPSRIVYANPCKTKSYIRFARDRGVLQMTFDNGTELQKIKDLYPQAHLILRLRCDALESQCPLGEKFGAKEEDVLPLLQQAKNLDLNVVGISFHVGSGCNDMTAFPRAIAASRRAFDVGASLGMKFKLLDIGGGFPGHPGPWPTFQELSSGIREALDAHFPAGEGIQIIAEPGRYFASSAFTLATNIIAKRGGNGAGQEDSMYYVNDGVYGSFNCLLYDHAQVSGRPLTHSTSTVDWQRCSVWGPTCDSLDCIGKDFLLPEMNVGDWILWDNMGAYTVSAATTFNGFPVSRIHNLISAQGWVRLCADRMFTSDGKERPKPTGDETESGVRNTGLVQPVS